MARIPESRKRSSQDRGLRRRRVLETCELFIYFAIAAILVVLMVVVEILDRILGAKLSKANVQDVEG